MLNISKKRSWFENPYDSYRLTKKERGNYVNVWFPRNLFLERKVRNKYKRYFNGDGNINIKDSLSTIIKVNKESSNHLYGEEYNPITLSISFDFMTSRKEGRNVFNMKACIMSIDDSSFGIWWLDKDRNYLIEQRLKVMRYIDSNKIIDGEHFLNHCIELGANSEKDYN
jgi:hypothetical protein